VICREVPCRSESGMNWKLLALAAVAGSQLTPVDESPRTPELALLMGDLQRLTHKLALSADAGNAELAAFYLHESKSSFGRSNPRHPSMKTFPSRLLIDRLAHPAYAPMQEAVTAKDAKRMREGMNAIVQACNACHTATQHAFIRITPGTEVNPFNQSFAP
jgi:hypothetical protein